MRRPSSFEVRATVRLVFGSFVAIHLLPCRCFTSVVLACIALVRRTRTGFWRGTWSPLTETTSDMEPIHHAVDSSRGFFLGKISFPVLRSLHCSGLYVSETATLLIRKTQLHSFRHRVHSSQASRSSPFLSFLSTRLPQHYKKLKKTVRSPPVTPAPCYCCVCLLIPSNNKRREKRSQQGTMKGKEGPCSSPLTAVACCMCGDPGISDELFRCKICHFRLQHK